MHVDAMGHRRQVVEYDLYRGGILGYVYDRHAFIAASIARVK